jgi:hypothetical protein
VRQTGNSARRRHIVPLKDNGCINKTVLTLLQASAHPATRAKGPALELRRRKCGKSL